MESQHDSEYDKFQQGERMNSLNLKWTVGFNYSIIDGVHNLTNKSRKEIFYASAHTGVIYDYENNVQRLLQGHCNKITCTAYCVNEDILVTADSGVDSMLVIWDARTGLPKKTIMDPHPNGVEALDITPDGQLIVTLSKEQQDGPNKSKQQVSLWNWMVDKDAMISQEMHPLLEDYQYHIRFNQFNVNEFATTGKDRVIFWTWEQNVKAFLYYSPEKKRNNSKLYTQTAFIPNSKQAVTGTDDGFIVVFDISLIMEDCTAADERRVIKMVNFMNNDDKLNAQQQQKKSAQINILKVQDQYLVVGASNGEIRFYDFQYRIMAWFEDQDISSITGISFAQDYVYSNQHYLQRAENRDDDKEDKDNQEQEFECPDFIVIDNQAKITLLKAQYFEEVDAQSKKGQVILKSILTEIISISVQPNSNMMAISCRNGHIYQWNFYEKQPYLNLLKVFDNDITCIDYSPDGKYLSCANEKGKVYFYDTNKNSSSDDSWFKLAVSEHESLNSPNILQQVFSRCSGYLATMDSDFSVCLFKLEVKYEDHENKEWSFCGKVRLHTRDITSISFGEGRNEYGEINLKLFSIGEDKRMAEYDVEKSSYKELVVVNVYDIEQEATPTASIWYPNSGIGEDILLTVNNDYKIKLWQIQNNQQRICRKTCLGPTYQGSVKKLLAIKSSNNKIGESSNYLAYTTKNKIIGIIKLPLDGNPNNTMGLVAHPEQITDMAATSDGKLIMTCGGRDLAINIWQFDVESLEQSFFREKEELGDDPYPNFLEGGHEGQTYKDLKDFFYYAQIRAKDENTTKARKLDAMVPLRSLSEMMRALGYYPTQKEIDNMVNEIKYSKVQDNIPEVQELGINEFLKLFVNHRPVYGITRNMIEDSMKELAQGRKSIKREDLIDLLTKEGEKMSQAELKSSLNVLLGDGNFEDILPEDIDMNFLLDELLGFEDLDDQTRDQIYSVDHEKTIKDQ